MNVQRSNTDRRRFEPSSDPYVHDGQAICIAISPSNATSPLRIDATAS